MQFSEEVKATLWKLIDEMSLNVSEFTVHPEKDFTRKKKWDFPTVLKFIISMESQSLKNELHKYFGYTMDCPSTASFNQRRAQIRAKAFQSLFVSFTAKYSKNPSLFKRALEKKYNQRLSEKESEDYINTSLSIVILCDSDDARKILEDTMNSIFTTFDVAAAPSFQTQRTIVESALSMGLVDYKIMRNVTVKTMKDIVGGENYADAEIEV